MCSLLVGSWMVRKDTSRTNVRRPWPVLIQVSSNFAHFICQVPCFSAGPSLLLVRLFLTEILEFWNKWISRVRMRRLNYLQRRTFSSRTVMKRSATGVYRSRRSDLDHCPRSLWHLVTSGNILQAPFSFVLFCFRKDAFGTHLHEYVSSLKRPGEVSPASNFFN